MYLLDTNHCSLLIEGNAEVRTRISQNTDALVATSIFVEAELFYMAYNSQKHVVNLTRVQNFLDAIVVYGLDSQTVNQYARLKADVMARFGPKEKSQRRRFTLNQLGISENDLWIAATALRHGLTVVSADADFVRLQQVRPFALENWLTV